MTLEISTAIIISVISLSFSVYMGLKGNKRTDTKDIEERTRERTELNVKLDFISSNMQDIKEQISSLVKDVQKHGDRLTKVEEMVKGNDEDLKRLRDRMDNMENRLNKEDR